MSLPFGELIFRITIMAKILLHDSEPTIKIYKKISIITVIKFEVVVSKKGHILKSLPLLNLKLLKPAPCSLL
jgi:hypothetical protein